MEIEAEIALGRPSPEELAVVTAFVNMIAPWFIERRTYMALFGFTERDPHQRRQHYLRLISRKIRPTDEELFRMRELTKIARPLCYVAECANQTVEQWMYTPHPDLPGQITPIELLCEPTRAAFLEWFDFANRCIEKNS
ncbi:MAG TPA: hypothetical protein VLB83_04185 [Candidatus Paceibacterota bacterium]|nr:hypothetical protein [Candidatus Paceibacterota bacterium]